VGAEHPIRRLPGRPARQPQPGGSDAADRHDDAGREPGKACEPHAYAPTNPAAFGSIDKAVEPWLSTAPANVEKGFVIDAAYWRDNQKALMERWAAWKLS